MTTQKIVTKTPELQVQGTVKTGHALQYNACSVLFLKNTQFPRRAQICNFREWSKIIHFSGF